MRLYQGKSKIPVTKTKKPKFSDHGGRTWDFGHVYIDGEKYDFHLDTTWGEYVYFQYGENNQWYKAKMYSDHLNDFKDNRWDIDPFGHTRLTTKPIANETSNI